MTTRFRWPATVTTMLLGILVTGSGCQRPAAAYEPGRVLSFRRAVVMDTVTAVLNGQVVGICQEKALPATVQMVSARNFFRTAADKQGGFQFLHIPAGTYQLSATCHGYGALVGDTIHLGLGDGSVVKIGLGCQMTSN